jgi:aromatic-L-amino-acid decarboxylase
MSKTSNPLPPDAVSLEFTAEQMQHMTDLCARHAIEHVLSLELRPSWNLDGVEEVAASFREPPPDQGTSIEELLPRIEQGASKTFTTPGPGYLAFIPGGGLFPGALGDYLAGALNRYVGVWNPAPALVQLELTTIDWIRELVGYPAGAQGLLTSGGSLSTLIALVTARRNRLPDDFLDGVIYVSSEVHHCVTKSALLAGFPEGNVHRIEVDERRRMRVDALEKQIETDRERNLRPFLVVSSAGTTNTGAIDPTPAIADLCERHDLWLHVDAAYGGFFRLLPQGRERLPGLERADSLVLDPHKGLFMSYGNGCLLVRDPEALRRAHQSRADYMQDLQRPDGAVNFSDISPELSRDFRGLRLWLCFKLLGVAAFRDNLREKLELARWAYEELRATPGFECLDEPQLSVVPFRYVPQRGDANDFNRRLLQRVNAKRRVFLTSTMLEEKFVLRIAVLSFRTHARHVQACVQDIVESARELEEAS